jgi:hypothetical protein
MDNIRGISQSTRISLAQPGPNDSGEAGPELFEELLASDAVAVGNAAEKRLDIAFAVAPFAVALLPVFGHRCPHSVRQPQFRK